MKIGYKKWRNVLSSIFLLTAFSINADQSKTINYTQQLKGLDYQIEQVLADFNIPGLAIAIVTKDKVIKAKGYGLRNIENKLPATADSQFAIGSATKAFTSFMLGTLVDEGRIDWNKPIKQYLPQWQLFDEYATHHVTLKDMLSHRTGLPRHDHIMEGFPRLTGEDLLSKLKYLEPSYELREKYQYNNLMYGLAGYLAEEVTNKNWSELIQARILNPLNMTNTSMSYQQVNTSPNHALPYDEISKSLTQIPQATRIDSMISPAGAMHSSANDMSQWLSMLLNNGKTQQHQLIKANTLQQMQLPQTPISTGLSSNKNFSPTAYGMGWHTRTIGGHYLNYHGGNIDGFTTMVFVYPQDDIAMVIMVNKDMSDIPYNLAIDISARLFFEEPTRRVKKLLEDRHAGINHHMNHGAMSKTKPRAKLSSTYAIKQYVGRYSHPAYGEVEISLRAGKLNLSYGVINEPFEHWNFNTFIGVGNSDTSSFDDEKMRFSIGNEGSVTTVYLPFETALKGVKFNRVQ